MNTIEPENNVKTEIVIEQLGPFKGAFCRRTQLHAAIFTLGLKGGVGITTKVKLYGRPWTLEDRVWGWDEVKWMNFAARVVALAIAKGPQHSSEPIEPRSIEESLTEAFGPNPPDATYHLPYRVHRPLPPEAD